jgi:hypothetical protein
VKYHSAWKQHQVAPLCRTSTINFLVLLQTVYKKIYCEEFILGIILFLVALLQGILREILELRNLSNIRVSEIKVGNKEVVGERHASREPKAVCEEYGTWLTEEKRICVSRRRCHLFPRGKRCDEGNGLRRVLRD